MSQSVPMKMMKKSELRIIGAISIDLNDTADEYQSNVRNKRNKTEICFSTFKEYCANATVHGVRYFMERKRHWMEKICWLISFALSVGWCAIGILNIWLKWYHRPVIVSFDDKTTSVGAISFPAITICTTQKYNKGQVDMAQIIETFFEMESNPSAYGSLLPERKNHFDTMLQLCQKELSNVDLIITKTESIYETITKLSPDKLSVIPFATFAGNIIHFEPIFTEEGLCFTFNSLNSRDIYTDEIAPELVTVQQNPNASYWNMIDEFDLIDIDKYLYPHRVFGAGLRNAAFMLMGIELDRAHEYCSVYGQGFRLSLHTPDVLPRDFIHIPVEQEIYISIKPNFMMTSRGLRNYSPKRRGCYFKSERQLRFFKSYDQHNCELECLTNYTKESCNCVRFSMPRDKNTAVCTVIDVRCYVSAGDRFFRDLVVKRCNCLPDCTSVTYDVEILQAPFRFTQEENELKKSLNESSDDVSTKLSVFFKHPQFIALNRTETYTIADLMASCGGLLGLFLGVSLLSIVEIIYYFTLRLCCTLKQHESIEGGDTTWAKRNNVSIVNRPSNRKRF